MFDRGTCVLSRNTDDDLGIFRPQNCNYSPEITVDLCRMGTWPLCPISFVETGCSVVKRSATVSCELRWNPTAEWPLACSSIGVMLPQRTVLSTALTGLLVLTVTATAFANASAKNPK